MSEHVDMLVSFSEFSCVMKHTQGEGCVLCCPFRRMLKHDSHCHETLKPSWFLSHEV